MATKPEVIRMLLDDMRDEHGAVILYLRHAYSMGEGEEAAEIEQIARDEMRHFKWLAQAVVQLGGVPTLDRTEMELGGTAPVQWMSRDVKAEEDAIAQYEAHLAAIDDSKVRALIERILTDERAHLGVFSSFKEEFEERGAEEQAGQGGQMPDEVARILDYGTQHEYTVVLQYLFHSFMTPDHEASRELETVAINEMQHLGWFGEYGAEQGHDPLFTSQPVNRSEYTDDMLKADLEAEKAVSRSYAEQAASLRGQESQTELVELLERARENEDYHIEVFRNMLARLNEDKPPYQRPGVGPTQPSGSLRAGAQPPTAGELSSGPKASTGEEAETRPFAPTGGRRPQFTVGSLIGKRQPSKKVD